MPHHVLYCLSEPKEGTTTAAGGKIRTATHLPLRRAICNSSPSEGFPSGGARSATTIRLGEALRNLTLCRCGGGSWIYKVLVYPNDLHRIEGVVRHTSKKKHKEFMASAEVGTFFKEDETLCIVASCSCA